MHTRLCGLRAALIKDGHKRYFAWQITSAQNTLGAAAGFSSYSNQIGLATGQVNEIYHPAIWLKEWKWEAVIGAAPRNNVIREKPAPGDVVIFTRRTYRTGRLWWCYRLI